MTRSATGSSCSWLLHESFVDEDRALVGDHVGVARSADDAAPTSHVQVALPQGDVKAPVHAGHREPHVLPGYFVEDFNGGIAQDPARIAAVEQCAADPTVDNFL